MRRDLAAVAEPVRAVIRSLVSGQSPWPLYLWGPAGTGKTSAGLVLLDHAAAAGPPSVSAAVADWRAGFVEVRLIPGVKIAADKGRHQWSKEGTSGVLDWAGALRLLAAAPVVVFDEIGVGRDASDFRLDALLESLETRASDPVRPFVVTGNVAPSDLPRLYDDRIADRILCGTVHRLAGDSRRWSRKAGAA